MSEITVKASVKSLRISPRKLNLVVSMIRRLKLQDALEQLFFSSKRIAKDVRKCLQSAISNAENNFGIDIDSLEIQSATVGKALVMRRIMYKAKGRRGIMLKSFSRLDIVLRSSNVNE